MEIINPIQFMVEEWRPITDKSVPGVVPGAYLVSNTGKVYSNFRDRYMNLEPTWNGYYRVCLRLVNNKSRYYLIHRIVMIEFFYIDNYQEMQVNHKDGIKSYNFCTNLEWTTGSENIKHAFNNGLKRQYHGEDCHWSTITNEQADKIGYLLTLQKYTHQEIADMIGCSKQVVGDISAGPNWSEIREKYNLDMYKKECRLRLSDNQLHELCRYFEIHDSEYKIKADLFRNALMDLFGIEYTQSMSATLSRIYNRKVRIDIVNRYKW